jgi:hypothetical protein
VVDGERDVAHRADLDRVHAADLAHHDPFSSLPTRGSRIAAGYDDRVAKSEPETPWLEMVKVPPFTS